MNGVKHFGNTPTKHISPMLPPNQSEPATPESGKRSRGETKHIQFLSVFLSILEHERSRPVTLFGTNDNSNPRHSMYAIFTYIGVV